MNTSYTLKQETDLNIPLYYSRGGNVCVALKIWEEAGTGTKYVVSIDLTENLSEHMVVFLNKWETLGEDAREGAISRMKLNEGCPDYADPLDRMNCKVMFPLTYTQKYMLTQADIVLTETNTYSP